MFRIVVFGLFLLGYVAFGNGYAQEAPPVFEESASSAERTLVLVNGKPITEADLRAMLVSRGIPQAKWGDVRERFLDRMIERRLMQEYLASRGVKPDSLELDMRMARVLRRITQAGDNPDEVLEKLSLTRDKLRDELAFSLAWQTHVREIITENQLHEYFREHRRELDGTEVRASHIFLPFDSEEGAAARAEVLERLRTIRREIERGDLSFAAAARKYSQAPSASDGGDVGFFTFRGKMPVAFTREVFSLDVGGMTEPFVTPFGAHLARVTEIKPGELSLEDVRNVVIERISSNVWDEIVARQRSAAEIHRFDAAD